MGSIVIVIAAATLAVQATPIADRTVNGEAGKPMPNIGMAPPAGTLMLGMTVTPSVEGTPIRYRVGSPMRAEAFLKGYAASAARAGFKTSGVKGRRVTGVRRDGTSFRLEVAPATTGSGSTGVLTLRPGKGGTA